MPPSGQQEWCVSRRGSQGMVATLAKSRNAETRHSCCPQQVDFSGMGRSVRTCRLRYRSLLQEVLQRRFDALLQVRTLRLRVT